MGHGHLGLVMLLSGALMVLVPLGIGILITAVVLHDRRRRNARGREGAEGGAVRDEPDGQR